MPTERKKQDDCEYLMFASITHAENTPAGEPQELYLCFSSRCLPIGCVPVPFWPDDGPTVSCASGRLTSGWPTTHPEPRNVER